MLKYKDLNNNVHEIELVEFEYMLPEDSIAITDIEALALQAPSPAEQLVLDEQQRISEIKSAGLILINNTFPALTNVDDIKFQAEFWLSIAPAARQATVDFQYVIDVYSIVKNAITNNTPSASVVWP